MAEIWSLLEVVHLTEKGQPSCASPGKLVLEPWFLCCITPPQEQVAAGFPEAPKFFGDTRETPTHRCEGTKYITTRLVAGGVHVGGGGHHSGLHRQCLDGLLD